MTMTREPVVFHGSKQDGKRLSIAIEHNCECDFQENGSIKIECTLHKAMLTNQRFLDGMAFLGTIRERLMQEEWR